LILWMGVKGDLEEVPQNEEDRDSLFWAVAANGR
jgi:hypothetical protein